MIWGLRVGLCLLLLAGAARVLSQLVGFEIARVHPTPAGLRQALEWDPQQPEPHYLLGLVHRDRPEHYDLERSRQHLEQAVRWNPHYWPYWMDLARTHDVSGSGDLARAAFQEAIRINPRAAVYRWRYANFLLREGDLDTALPEFRQALELEPSQYLLPTVSLLWRAGVGGESILSIWPQGKYARLNFMRFLSTQEDAPPDLLADQWEQLLAHDPSVQEGDFYIRFLLEGSRFGEARAQWARLAGGSFESGIWNDGFEQEWSGGSLDWIHDPKLVERVPGGLRIEFDGTGNIDFNGLRQQVVVQPNTEYELVFRARSEGITTERGPYFEILADRVLAATEPILGTTDWQDRSARFRVPAGHQLVRVQLRRRPSRRIDNRLKGTLWLEWVRLRKVF